MRTGKDKDIQPKKIIRNGKSEEEKKDAFQFKDQRPKSKQLNSFRQLAENSPKVKRIKTIQKKANKELPDSSKSNQTGLPNQLKSGIENLSGQSMDDVKVHRNSSKPAQLNAHAYAQGTDIHLAAGQEKHLPHEAWHVVQQKQGRVKPTIKINGGVPVNDDKRLESEADSMGAKASGFNGVQRRVKSSASVDGEVAQRVPNEREEYKTIVQYFNDNGGVGGEAGELIEDLTDYVALGKDGRDKELIEKIQAAVGNPEIMEVLRKKVKSDEHGGTAKWALISHHLKSATSDEVAEYGSFIGRWAGRTNKWEKNGATLSVKSGMQYALGNTVSASAFASRAVLNETHLLLSNSVSLSRKLENPNAYHSTITGVSELMEVSKFFETWTASGLLPSFKDAKSTADMLKVSSNYIKKTRAGLTFLEKGMASFSKFEHGTNVMITKVSKYIHDLMGTTELVLNSMSIGGEGVTEQIVNNVAKGVRHLLDHLVALMNLLISAIKKGVSFIADKIAERRAGTEKEKLIKDEERGDDLSV